MTRRGYILVEVSVSYLILSLALAALVPAYIATIKANKNTEKIRVATDLSREMIEEVRVRRWDENTPIAQAVYISTPSTTIGIDAGETASNKTTFNDIDDFNGWTETGKKDPMGAAISDFSAFNTSVTVRYVTSAYAVSASTTDYKMVTACTWTAGLASICLDTVLTNR